MGGEVGGDVVGGGDTGALVLGRVDEASQLN